MLAYAKLQIAYKIFFYQLVFNPFFDRQDKSCHHIVHVIFLFMSYL